MSRRLALIVSAALTAFLIVGTSALVIRLIGPTSTAAATSADNRGPTSVDDGTPQASDRELVYRQRLDEANDRLRQAYDRMSALETELLALRSRIDAAPASVPPSPQRAVAQADSLLTRDQATQIAAQVAGGGRVRSIELEREKGKTYYEVEIGDKKVYIDARSGEATLARKKSGADRD